MGPVLDLPLPAGVRSSRDPAARRIGGLATHRNTTAKDPLALFSAPVRKWFEASFDGPTPAQATGWPPIASGANTLICAPTGSGKTLAAFLRSEEHTSELQSPDHLVC